MRDDPQRQGVALALLAVLVGAIVQVSSGSGPFTLWHTMVGLIMLLTALAYDKEIDAGVSAEATAFAMIIAAGIVFIFGFLLDRLFLRWGVVSWQGGARDELVSVPGFVSFYLHDDLYLAIWLAVAAGTFAWRYQRHRTPEPDGRTD